MPALSFVIPCLNESETIAEVVAEALAFAEASSTAAEVIVADNGSTDGSTMLAAAAGAVVIDEPARGYGSAIRAGLEHATGTAVVILDADGQHDPWQAARLLEPLGSGAEVVIGRRVETGGMRSTGWLKRRVGGPALSALGRAVSGCGVSDFHCGFRAARREALCGLGLRSTGMEFATEMIVAAHRAGLAIAEAPVVVRPPGRGRPPHLRPVRDGLRHLACLANARRGGHGGG